jgi:hypothetical protein
MTVFGVLGTLWFALHAVEYVYARYDALQARVPLPDPLGLSEMFAAMPQWAAISLTATIWLGLLGAVLLLLRDSAAVLILSLTLIATLPVAAWAVNRLLWRRGFCCRCKPSFLCGRTGSGDIWPLALCPHGQALRPLLIPSRLPACKGWHDCNFRLAARAAKNTGAKHDHPRQSVTSHRQYAPYPLEQGQRGDGL